jgi:hypothetical protein
VKGFDPITARAGVDLTQVLDHHLSCRAGSVSVGN